jgi:hypothetical protein
MKKLIPLLALVLCCLSCDPPFDLSYSQAAAVVSKMTLRQTLAPVYGLEGDRENLDIVFLPDKKAAAPGIDFQNGFLLLRGTYRTMLRHVRFDSAKSSYNAFGWWSAEYLDPDPYYHRYLFEPLKFSSVANSFVGMFSMDPDYPQNRRFHILNATFVDGSLVPQFEWNLKDDLLRNAPPPVYDANVMGFSINPRDLAQPFDDSYWLVRIVNPPIDAGKLMEVSMSLNAGGLFTKADTKPGAALFDIPELAGADRCLYYYDPGRAQSYVSWFDTAAGGWRCISWKGMTATPERSLLPGVTHRIDALLTTGRLFSTEGGVGRVYDGNGTEIASFPLGALRFIGERYVDGQPLALFSLARIVTERYSETLAIDVYSIPAADLETLGE